VVLAPSTRGGRISRLWEHRNPAVSESGCGSWSTCPTPLIVTIQYDPIKFRLAIAELVARLARPFILLAPTADHMDARCQETLAQPRAYPSLGAKRPPEVRRNGRVEVKR
jgi:hypothetical protein